MARGVVCSPNCATLTRSTGPMRYDVRSDRVGWTVFDTATGRPAMLEDLVLVELDLDVAEDLANLLNRRDLSQSLPEPAGRTVSQSRSSWRH
jgi:hypothetical protein